MPSSDGDLTRGVIAEGFEVIGWIDRDERDEGLASGRFERLHEMRGDKPHFIGYTSDRPKSDCKPSLKTSPSGITAAESLAALGVSRFPDGEISPEQQYRAQQKIKAFGMSHRSYGLTTEQKERVDAEIRKGASARQAAVRLGLTKEFVDRYVKAGHKFAVLAT